MDPAQEMATRIVTRIPAGLPKRDEAAATATAEFQLQQVDYAPAKFDLMLDFNARSNGSAASDLGRGFHSQRCWPGQRYQPALLEHKKYALTLSHPSYAQSPPYIAAQ